MDNLVVVFCDVDDFCAVFIPHTMQLFFLVCIRCLLK